MSKLYSRLEQIFKFRLLSNLDISDYLKRMSNMGKIDDVKKIALFNLILTKLGEIEDKEEEIKFQAIDPLPTPPEIHAPPVDKELEARELLEKGILSPLDNPLKCPDCEMVAKSKLGLISHSRKHKK